MNAPIRKWIPTQEGEIEKEYLGYQTFDEGDDCYHMCAITYKGNGIGWCWNDPKNEVKNISRLERYTTFQEQEAFYKDRFDLSDSQTQLNLYGLFNDMYDTGNACHEMWNAWVCADFYELNDNLKEENMILIGIAAAPYEWNVGGDCCAYVIEDVVTGSCYWCHGAKDWVDNMREQMQEVYDELRSE